MSTNTPESSPTTDITLTPSPIPPTEISVPEFTPEPTLSFDEYLIELRSLDTYLSYLLDQEQAGGTMTCVSESSMEDVEYYDCEAFYDYKELGCYGWNTFDMYREDYYDGLCKLITRLNQANASSLDYFDLRSPDWWKSISAEVIPGRGGIYSKEEAEEAMRERDALVAGKRLGEIDFLSAEAFYDGEGGYYCFEGILSSENYVDCGIVYDMFVFCPALIADFDQDGLGEMLISGSRNYESDECFLGSGNLLGAFFEVILEKDYESGPIEIIPYP
jgi:hypothetical protein